MSPSTPQRPTPRSAGPIRYRVVRGPKMEGAAVRWYWRATRYTGGGEETAWCGWATVEEADFTVAGLVRGEAPAADAIRTVADLLSFWHGAIEARHDLAPATVAGYAESARRVKAIIGDVLVARVDRGTVERLRDRGLGLGRTPRTVRRDLVVLGLAWRWGRECGHLSGDLPRVGVVLPEIRRPRATEDSIAAVLDTLPPAQRLHLLLLADRGFRISEIAGLRRRDVEGRWVTVTGKGRTRRVPLTPAAAAELAAWMEAHPGPPEGYVLGYTPSSAKGLLSRALRASGVAWTSRGLRDASVRRAYREMMDPSLAGKLHGHSAEVALRHYRQAEEEEMLEALDRPDLPPTRPGRPPSRRRPVFRRPR